MTQDNNKMPRKYKLLIFLIKLELWVFVLSLVIK